MTWRRVIDRLPPRVREETRAGIIVGWRMSDEHEAVNALMDVAKPPLEVWIVDDANGLAPTQPVFFGEVVMQAYGLDGDHRAGLSVPELLARIEAAKARVTRPSSALGDIGAWFVWSGPLCGGILAKGAFQETYDDADLWHTSAAPLRIYCASRGAHQEPAPGGVLGVSLFHAIYDAANEPPAVTTTLLSSQDDALTAGGIVDARVFVLPDYD